MFSAYPHLLDVSDAKHYGITVYLHTDHGYVWFWFGVLCWVVLCGGQLVLVCLGFSAVHLSRPVSVSSLRSLLQGMETDEISSKTIFSW